MTRIDGQTVSLSSGNWISLVGVLLAAVGGLWYALSLKVDPALEQIEALNSVQRTQAAQIAEMRSESFSARNGHEMTIAITRLSTQVVSLEKEIERLRNTK